MKILITHASAGAGHAKAAEAVFNAIRKTGEHSAVFADALDHTSRFYKTVYRTVYTFLITKIPWLWGLFFRLLDVPSLQGTVRTLRRVNNAVMGARLQDYLEKEQFDVIVSTHFFPNETAAALKREGRIRSKIFCVVTDYDVHRIWLADGIDHYAVACEYTQQKLVSLGIAQDKITVSGIPVDGKFAKTVDRSLLRRELGLRDDIFTVLVATGSFGIGPIEQIAHKLTDCQVLVICGRNQKLFERLNRQKGELLKVYGLVNNMDEMMAVADCMVTKPGGLSISEALVRNLPLVFFNAIPGQESKNVEVLRASGVGFMPSGIEEIVRQVRELKSPGLLQQQKDNIRKLAKPDAVGFILHHVLQ